MKTLNMQIIVLLVVLAVGLSSFYLRQQNTENLIIGIWVSESDSKSKIVFSNDGKCKEYYDNILEGEYSYIIDNSSPQCETIVPIDVNTNYLQLINVNDAHDKNCFEINGVTDQKLSLRYLSMGGAIVYDRQ